MTKVKIEASPTVYYQNLKSDPDIFEIISTNFRNYSFGISVVKIAFVIARKEIV